MAKISKQELIQLQKELKSDPKIGEKLGISRQRVHHLRKKYGIPFLKSKNDERNAKIIAMFKQGKTSVVIAKKMNLSKAYVNSIYHPHKKAKDKK